MTILNQISIFDTVFEFIEKYDPEIKNIRIYGILDEHGKCKDPYFMTCDVLEYLNKSPDIKKNLKNFTKDEAIKKLVIKKVKPLECNMLTKYGLIRCISFCDNKTKASITLRYLIYELFDTVNKDVLDKFHTNVISDDVQNQLIQVDNDDKNYVVYFIKNIETGNIKIGLTNNIETQLINLQTGNECELKIIKTIPCESFTESRKLEASLHSIFNNFHIRSEWFKITDEQIESCY
jgi:hypothetical protein